jgi:hypothetical protein
MKKLIIPLIIGLAFTFSCNQTYKGGSTAGSTKDTIVVDTTIVVHSSVKSSVKFTEISETSISNNGKPSHFFSVYVQNFKDNEKVWKDIEDEAYSKPYENYTVVYFFDNKKFTPVFTQGCDFSKKYDKHCVAAFWHYPNGSINFVKYPMNQ